MDVNELAYKLYRDEEQMRYDNLSKRRYKHSFCAICNYDVFINNDIFDKYRYEALIKIRNNKLNKIHGIKC